MNKNFIIWAYVLISCCVLPAFGIPGTLDTTFNSTGTLPGTVATPVDNVPSTANGVAIQKDGKIVVVGSTAIAGVNRFAVARFYDNGTLDTTFNSAGTLPGTTFTNIDGSTSSVANEVSIQDDGKIVVVGVAVIGGLNHFALARFNSDGTLDTTFNSAGTLPGTAFTTIATSTNATAFGVGIQQDGKIVVSGDAIIAGTDRFGVARFYDNGTLDTTFNSSGVLPGTTFTSIGSPTNRSAGNGLVLQADGKIIMVGFVNVSAIARFGVARFNTDGSLDTTFNSSGTLPGTAFTSVGGPTNRSLGSRVVLQKNGKIVIGGQAFIGVLSHFGAARFNTDGSLDTTFNSTGTLPGTTLTTVGGPTNNSQGFAIGLEPDDKFVLVGLVTISGLIRFGVAQFDAQGVLDTTFNPQGTLPGTAYTTIEQPTFDSRSFSVAIQQDGKIVLAGRVRNSALEDNFAVARFNEFETTNSCALQVIIKYGQRV